MYGLRAHFIKQIAPLHRGSQAKKTVVFMAYHYISKGGSDGDHLEKLTKKWYNVSTN